MREGHTGHFALNLLDETCRERAQIHVASQAVGLYRRSYIILGWRVDGVLSQSARGGTATMWLSRRSPAHHRQRLALLDMEAAFVVEAIHRMKCRRRRAIRVAAALVAAVGALGTFIGMTVFGGDVPPVALCFTGVIWGASVVAIARMVDRLTRADAAFWEKPYFDELGWIGQRTLELR